MKARMKKIEILCPQTTVKPLLNELRDLECLHFEALEEDIKFLENPDYKLFHGAYQLAVKNQTESPTTLSGDAQEINLTEHSKLIIALEEELKILDSKLKKNSQKLFLKGIWGDYDLNKWKRLEAVGMKLKFFRLAKSQFEKLNNEEVQPILIKEEKENYYFARIISEEELDTFAAEALSMPLESLAVLEQEKAQLNAHLAKAQNEIKAASLYLADLKKQTLSLQDKLKEERILESSYPLEKLKTKHLKCWFNDLNEELVQQKLNEYHCAYKISSPSSSDPVPILLSNNKFNKLFEPITEIFQLPHYFEFDLTPFIAVFYPILFAYCLGDAGYGFIVSSVAIFGYFSFLKKQKGLALLTLVLGLSTLVMGFIKSGSLFGIPLLESSSLPWVRSLSNLVLIPDNSDYFFNAFNVALLIGLLQILVGIIIAIVKTWTYKGFLPALAQMGKLIIVISSVSLFLEDTLLLTESIILFLKLGLAAGIAMVMLFHDMSQHLFSRLGSSVLPLFFIFTGLLGDVLSYVRLFALGVTSGVLGLVVNQIGTDMMGDSWYSYVGAIAFLIFGHSLNLALAVLGSFIHPLRLTFVEFYNNAQFEGGGKAFEAFTKSIKIN